MKIPIFAALLLICSCNRIEDRSINSVDFEHKKVDAKIDSDVSEAKIRFYQEYESAIHRSGESRKQEINSIFLKINACLGFIDSLQVKMIELNNENPDNLEVIRKLFILEGLADTLYNNLKNSYGLAQKICLKQTNKTEINKIADNSLNFWNGVKGWKVQFFQQNTPFGVRMILFGLETELLKAGSISFSE